MEKRKRSLVFFVTVFLAICIVASSVIADMGITSYPCSHLRVRDTVMKHPTCSEYGEIYTTCDNRCGYLKITYIDKLPHDLNLPVVIRQPTCSLSGLYVPANFDTIEKAFSGVKTAEKGIK